MHSTLPCTIALLAWIPLAIALFLSFPPRHAIFITALIGFLFLPMSQIDSSFLPYTKFTAIPLGLLAGALVGDTAHLLSFRPKWFDLPMLMLCSGQIFSGLLNAQSFYDSAASAATNTVMYGVPYFLGRIYLSDAAALHRFAMALFYGGLIYIPFCIVEMRFGPEFHNWVYGYYAHPDYIQSIREGGYRPIVFMQHGLMLGLFMTVASLCGLWLWIRKALPKSILYLPTAFWVLLLLGVTINCRSTGAWVLLAVGLLILFGTRPLRSYAMALVVAAIPIAYMTARTAYGWRAQYFVDLSKHYLNEDRANSLLNRIENGDLILGRALQRPYFGWGPLGREKVKRPDNEKEIVTPDGMWDAVLGQMGWFGVVGAYGVFLLPPLLLFWRFPHKTWGHPVLAAAEVLAVVGLLYALDNLMNNMVNPLFYLGLGGVATFAANPRLGAWPSSPRRPPLANAGAAVKMRTSA